MVVFCSCEKVSRPGIFTDRYSALFKTLNPLIALLSARTVLPVCLIKQLKFLCKFLPRFQQNVSPSPSLTHSLSLSLSLSHTHKHARARERCSSSFFIVTLSLIRWNVCARAQFNGCSSTTNVHSKTGQMSVCCQNLTLGALSSRRALSVLVGAPFKKFCPFLNRPRMSHNTKAGYNFYITTYSDKCINSICLSVFQEFCAHLGPWSPPAPQILRHRRRSAQLQ
jgi:hypothetical protein